MIRRGDILVFVMAALLLPWLYAAYWSDGRAGDFARILVGGQQVELVDLHSPRTLHVHGLLGDSVLEVRDGRVRFVDSPCAGKQCIHNGWIHLGGDVVSCLPNQVSVAVLGGEQRFDAVNF